MFIILTDVENGTKHRVNIRNVIGYAPCRHEDNPATRINTVNEYLFYVVSETAEEIDQRLNKAYGGLVNEN